MNYLRYLKTHLRRHIHCFRLLPNWLTAVVSCQSGFLKKLSYRTRLQFKHLCLFSSECTIRNDLCAIYNNYIVDTGQCQQIDMWTLANLKAAHEFDKTPPKPKKDKTYKKIDHRN